MLSISDPGKGGPSADYYFRYYSECIEDAEWFGSGAKILGLEGKVDQAIYTNLMDGRSPDGSHDLVQNAGKANHVSHWDLVFNAPKSASVRYALGSDEERKQILAAHKDAVMAGINYMESCAAFTRRGKGGKIIEPCALVGSSFIHISSRAHDVHLHSHAVVANIGIRQDGTTGSLHSLELFNHKLAAGAVYQAKFADGLKQRLGLIIEVERVGFHIQGVPKELCREQSKRRQQVEETLKQNGAQGAAASRLAAEITRPKKTPMTKDLVLERCRKDAEAFGWRAEQAAKLVDDALKGKSESERQKHQVSISAEKKACDHNAKDHKAKEERGTGRETEEKKSSDANIKRQQTKSSANDEQSRGPNPKQAAQEQSKTGQQTKRRSANAAAKQAKGEKKELSGSRRICDVRLTEHTLKHRLSNWSQKSRCGLP